jgi:hypothetical protein
VLGGEALRLDPLGVSLGLLGEIPRYVLFLRQPVCLGVLLDERVRQVLDRLPSVGGGGVVLPLDLVHGAALANQG